MKIYIEFTGIPEGVDINISELIHKHYPTRFAPDSQQFTKIDVKDTSKIVYIAATVKGQGSRNIYFLIALLKYNSFEAIYKDSNVIDGDKFKTVEDTIIRTRNYINNLYKIVNHGNQ